MINQLNLNKTKQNKLNIKQILYSVVTKNLREIFKLNKFYLFVVFFLLLTASLVSTVFSHGQDLIDTQREIIKIKNDTKKSAKEFSKFKEELESVTNKLKKASKPPVSKELVKSQKNIIIEMISQFNTISRGVVSVSFNQFIDDRHSNSFICTLTVNTKVPQFAIFPIIFFESIGKIESYKDNKLTIRIIQHV